MDNPLVSVVVVTFNSAEGSEVTATFTDYAAVAKPPQP